MAPGPLAVAVRPDKPPLQFAAVRRVSPHGSPTTVAIVFASASAISAFVGDELDHETTQESVAGTQLVPATACPWPQVSCRVDRASNHPLILVATVSTQIDAGLRRRPGRPRKIADARPNSTALNGEERDDAEPSAQVSEGLAPRLLDLVQTAQYLGVCAWTVRDLEASGTLQRVSIPLAGGRELRKLLFDRGDLDRLVDAWKIPSLTPRAGARYRRAPARPGQS
jgi:hypothetical protein